MPQLQLHSAAAMRTRVCAPLSSLALQLSWLCCIAGVQDAGAVTVLSQTQVQSLQVRTCARKAQKAADFV